MATATKTAPSIHQVAAELYRTHDGNEEKTANALRARIRHDAALRDEAICYVVDMLVGSQVSHERSDKLTAAEPNPDRAMTDVGLEARGRSALMTYKLPETMKLLGEANKEEVHAAYEHHRKSRSAHGLRERWFFSIWKAMSDAAAPVKKQLKESDLRRMEARARKDEEAR